jgi:nicotinamide mononucleotide adenylyltransferase
MERFVTKESEKQYPMALIIGRFQPFCNHHVEVLQDVAKKTGVKKILLGIGVTKKTDERNFLTYEERKEIITPILENLGVEYEIRAIPDIHNPPKYGEYVESIFPEIKENNTRVFTDNDYTSDCFVNYGHNYEIVVPKVISPIRATLVRQLMKTDNNWEQYVLPNVANYLKSNGCIERLKEISNF